MVTHKASQDTVSHHSQATVSHHSQAMVTHQVSQAMASHPATDSHSQVTDIHLEAMANPEDMDNHLSQAMVNQEVMDNQVTVSQVAMDNQVTDIHQVSQDTDNQLTASQATVTHQASQDMDNQEAMVTHQANQVTANQAGTDNQAVELTDIHPTHTEDEQIILIKASQI